MTATTLPRRRLSGLREFGSSVSTIMSKELRSRFRGRRAFVVLTIYLAVLALIAYGAYISSVADAKVPEQLSAPDGSSVSVANGSAIVGQAIFAIGGSEESARLMGVPVDRTKVIAYATSGALAGLAGALLAAQLAAGQPVAGAGWELDAISAVVVGGTLLTGGAGTLSGSLAGVLLLGILQNLINQLGTLGSYAQQLVSGVFLIAVVLVQAYLTRKQRS